MRIEGKIEKSGRFYAVEIPLLCIHTQGKSLKEAFAMAKDAVEAIVNVEDFHAAVDAGSDGTFTVYGSEEGPLYAAILRQQRAAHGLTVRDVQARLGDSSPNAYSAYETGRRVPSVEKWSELMCAIDPGARIVMCLRRD